MKILLAVLLFTRFCCGLAFAVDLDLDGYYITPKGGVSKSMDTGATNFDNGGPFNQQDEDLGTGTAFGVSAGKYITDNFRLELEAIKRTGYELDTTDADGNPFRYKADMETTSLFINSFYDFKPFSIGNTPITPYLGGGIGVSRNKIGAIVAHTNEVPDGGVIDGKTISQFAYNLSAGTLFNLTDKLSLDVNYQYVNLGAFKSDTTLNISGAFCCNMNKPINGGEIKSHALMVGLQYKFN
jgi:opacity protein-like surface antigen